MHFGSVLAWCVVALAVLIMAVAVEASFERVPDRAVVLRDASTGDGRVATLPNHWIGPSDRVVSRRFTLYFDYDGNAQTRSALYIPYVEQRAVITLNDRLVEQNPWGGQGPGPLRRMPLLVSLPQDHVVSGRNRLDIEVETGPVRFGGLSVVYLGRPNDFVGLYRYRLFWGRDVKIAIFGANLFLAAACACIVILRPRESVLAWLGWAIGISCVMGGSIFGNGSGGAVGIQPWLLTLAPGAAIAFVGYLRERSGLACPRIMVVGMWGAPAATFACALVPSVGILWAIVFLTVPITILVLIYAFWLLVIHARSEPSADLGVLLLGVGSLLLATSHAAAVRVGMIESPVFFIQFARLIIVLGLAIGLMKRWAEIANELDSAAQTLAMRLAEKEDQLARVFDVQRRQAEREAEENERQRITAELHDGVAGYLAVIVALAETPETDGREIECTARHALTELRLVVDAMSLREREFGVALARLRENTEKPLQRLGICTEWVVAKNVDRVKIYPHQGLDILRIIQEAIANAVRHGRPSRIRVEISVDGSQKLIVAVQNSGGRRLAMDRRGRGVTNMEARAVALGGLLTFGALQDGGVVQLKVPVVFS